jgi:hypothetical protein
MLVPRDGKGGGAKALHRIAFLRRNSIPPGRELDHICANRACCNPRHLRVLTVSDHKRITAAYRYSEVREAAWAHWTYYGSKPQEIAEQFGFKRKTVEGWQTQWNKGAKAA